MRCPHIYPQWPEKTGKLENSMVSKPRHVLIKSIRGLDQIRKSDVRRSGHFLVPAPAGGSAVHFCSPAKMSAGTSLCPPLRAAPPCIFALLQKCQRALPCARPCGRLRRAFLLSCKNVSGHFLVPAPAGGSAVHFCSPAKMSAGTSLCPPLRAAPPCIFAVLQKCQRALPCARPCGRLRRAFLLSCKNVVNAEGKIPKSAKRKRDSCVSCTPPHGAVRKTHNFAFHVPFFTWGLTNGHIREHRHDPRLETPRIERLGHRQAHGTQPQNRVQAP